MQHQNWEIEWEPVAQGFLSLRNSIMEAICRFLPTQRDRYEACLIHPYWRTAATVVLWEAPEFRNPDSFKRFLKVVFASKRCALAVKHLSLCVHDPEFETVFRPVMDSECRRHNMKNTILDKPELILSLASQCEMLQSLRVYGWRIDANMIEQLAGDLPQLQSITITGANPEAEKNFTLNNILSRLRELRLDGSFVLSKQFAINLVSRGQNLQSLQLPLQGTSQETFARLCSGNFRLKKLTLTHVSPMQDDHFERLLWSMTELEELCLEGGVLLTPNILNMALKLCSKLTSIEIRASRKSLESAGKPNGRWSQWNFGPVRLQRLVLENFAINDDTLLGIARVSPLLTTLGLSNCPDISDASVARLCQNGQHLRTLNVIKCPGVTESTLEAISEASIHKVIRHIHIESSGEIKPKAMYILCCKCADYNLRLVRLIGYENISQSFVGGFATELKDREQSRDDGASPNSGVVTLDETAIDAMANTHPTGDSDIDGLPETRVLSGQSIVLLAQELRMPTSKLESLLDHVINLSTEKNVEKETRWSAAFVERETPKKAASRLDALKGHQLRPTTPALWVSANQATVDQYIHKPATGLGQKSQAQRMQTRRVSDVRDQRHAETYSHSSTTHSSPSPHPPGQTTSEPTTDSPSPPFKYDERVFQRERYAASQQEEDEGDEDYEGNEGDDDGDYVEDEEEENEDEQDVDDFAAEGMENPEPTSEEEWPSLSGKTKSTEIDLGGWGATKGVSWVNKSKSNVKKTSASPVSSRTTPQRQAWTPHTLENHEEDWKPIVVEAPVLQRPKKGARVNAFSLENDGWGTAKAYVPWDDLRTQGFAHDVLQQQKNTTFWNMENGQWKQLTLNETKQANESPRLSQQPVQQPVQSPAKSSPQGMTSSRQQFSRRHKEVEHKPVYNGSLSSDDDEIDWTADDGVTILTSTPLKTSLTRPAATVKDAPKKPYTRSAIDSPTASDDWTNFTAGLNANGPARRKAEPQTSLRQKFSGSNARRSSNRDMIPPEQMPGQWGIFQANQSQWTASDVVGQRQSQAPSQPANQPEATSNVQTEILIDTSDSVSQSPAKKTNTSAHDTGFWQTMSSLTEQPAEPAKNEKKEDGLFDLKEEYNWGDIQTRPNASPSSSETDKLKEHDDKINDVVSEDLVDCAEEDKPLSAKSETHPLTENTLPKEEPSSPAPFRSTSPALASSIATSTGPSTPAMAESKTATLLDDTPRPLSPVANNTAPEASQNTSKARDQEASAQTSVNGTAANSSSTTHEDYGKRVSCIVVETEKHDKQTLKLYENRPIEDSVKEFCDNYEMHALYNRLLVYANERYSYHKARRLLGKKKKKSKQNAEKA